MITASQLRAARALLGMDQKTLAALAGVSLPTIQRMEASDGNVRGHRRHPDKGGDGARRGRDRTDRATGARSDKGGRGVRLKTAEAPRGGTD